MLVIGDDATRPYGHTNPIFTAVITGLLPGDNITPVFYTVATSASPLGRYDIEIYLDDPDGKLGYYDVIMWGGRLTVAPAVLTGTIASQSRSYGQTNSPFTVAYTGFVNGQNSNILHGPLTLACTTSGGSPVGAGTPVGAYPIQATTPQTATNYTVEYVNGTLTITPVVLLVTADDATRVYGATNPPLTAQITGFVNGETSSVLGGTLSVTTAATVTSPVGTQAITPAGLTASNYDLHFVDGTLTITPAALSGQVDVASRAYGDTNPAYPVTYTGFRNGDTTNVLSGAVVFSCLDTNSVAVDTNTPIGVYPLHVVTGATATNYTLSYLDSTLTVTQAVLLVTAEDKARRYGAANPPLTATVTGWKNGETTNVLGGALVLSCPAGTNSPVGAYLITAAGWTADNYALSYVAATLTVGPVPLTVTADSPARGYGTPNPELTLSYSGFVNDEGPSALTTLPAAATLATTASPANTYPITVTGGSATNYSLTLVDGTLTVTQAVLVVTADAQARLYGAPNPPLTLTYTGFVLGEDAGVLTTPPAAQTAATTASPVGTYPITVTGGSAANYALTLVNGVLTIGPAPLSLTASNAARSWGQPNPVFTGTVVGALLGDVIPVSYSCVAGSNSAVGTYPIVPSLSEPAGVATNYTATLHNGVLTITFDGGSIIALTQTPWLYTVGLDPLLLEMYGLEEKLVDAGALVFEGGSTNFDGGTLTVDLSMNANVADTLAVLPEGSGAGQIDVAGDTVTYGGVTFGTMAGGTNGGALTFGFNTNAASAVVQALIRRLAFSSTDESTNCRTVRMVLTDGDGGVSAPATRLLGINRSPRTVDRYITVRDGVNTSLSIAWIIAEATDADNDPITLTDSSIVSANGGRILKSGTNLVYRPAEGFAGQDVFAYVVIDGRGGESMGLVWITVLRQNTLALDLSKLNAPAPDTGARIQMAGLPGRTYWIEASEDLVHWTVLSTELAPVTGIITVLDAVAKDHPQRFYRAVEQ